MSKWVEWEPTDEGSIKLVTLDRHHVLEKQLNKMLTGLMDEVLNLYALFNKLDARLSALESSKEEETSSKPDPWLERRGDA